MDESNFTSKLVHVQKCKSKFTWPQVKLACASELHLR